MKTITILLLSVLVAACSSQQVRVFSDDNVVYSGKVTSKEGDKLKISVDGDGTTCTGSIKIPSGTGVTEGEINCDSGDSGAFVATFVDKMSVGVGRLAGRAAFAMLIDLEE